MAAIEHAFGNLTPLLQEYGVAAVALILMLESLGLPVPGESLLILASILAARGDLSLPSLLVFAWAGAVVGDNIGYVLGRTFGRAVVLRLGGRIGFEADRLSQVEEMFARYGPLTGAHVGDVAALAHHFGMAGVAVAATIVLAVVWLKWPRGRQHVG